MPVATAYGLNTYFDSFELQQEEWLFLYVLAYLGTSWPRQGFDCRVIKHAVVAEPAGWRGNACPIRQAGAADSANLLLRVRTPLGTLFSSTVSGRTSNPQVLMFVP